MKAKKFITIVILLVLIPAFVVLGSVLFKEKYYSYMSLLIAVLSFIPVFYSFEKRENSSKELSVLAVMIALSVVGRFVFSFLPGFKPVTAITVITAIYLGSEAGFLIGSISAVISNFYFGQGPWTPFQMLAWGIIGFVAGIISKPLKKSKLILIAYGVFSGVMFSLTMDIWTVLWADGTFNISRYIASQTAALPLTVEYAISNVIFLILLTKPIGQKLERIKNKYGLFLNKNKGV